MVNGAEAGVALNVTLATMGKDSAMGDAFAALGSGTTGWPLTAYGAVPLLASLREGSLREALSEQRLQIARELHDIVAHAMSVVAVQAGVGSHL